VSWETHRTNKWEPQYIYSIFSDRLENKLFLALIARHAKGGGAEKCKQKATEEGSEACGSCAAAVAAYMGAAVASLNSSCEGEPSKIVTPGASENSETGSNLKY
jgi:hypothetical protein